MYQTVPETPLAWQQTIATSFQRGRLYLNYDTKLTADALFRSESYRQQLVDEIASARQLSPENTADFTLQQKQAFANRFEFLLFVYGGDNDKISIGERDSLWQIRMLDDDGDRIAPVEVRRIKRTNPEIELLKKHLRDVDRWVEVYEVVFPKLNKPAVGVPIGTTLPQLIISGVQGRVELSWPEPTLFY
jgi:hypothetical protein